MRKKWITAALVCTLVLTGGCGKSKNAEADNSSTDSTASGIAGQYPDSKITKLGNYKGVEIAKENVEVSDDEVQSEIDNLLASYPEYQKLDETTVEDGDWVNIDFVGKKDGEAFEGGSSSEGGYDLLIGSGSFIDGFEDQIVGHKPGETFDVTVTFPDGYRDSTDADGNALVLSGKQAVFSVTLNSIEEEVLPELTDAWVDENYGTSDDLHSVEALRAFCQQQLYTSNLNTAVMDYLIDNATFSEVPKAVTDYQVTQCLNYYDKMAQYYGYDLDTFVQSMLGYDSADAMLAAMADSIESYAKEALLYQAVAEAMDLAPTQEQIDAYSAYTDTYGANYCTMIAMMDTVTDALTTGAQVK